MQVKHSTGNIITFKYIIFNYKEEIIHVEKDLI